MAYLCYFAVVTLACGLIDEAGRGCGVSRYHYGFIIASLVFFGTVAGSEYGIQNDSGIFEMDGIQLPAL